MERVGRRHLDAPRGSYCYGPFVEVTLYVGWEVAYLEP